MFVVYYKMETYTKICVESMSGSQTINKLQNGMCSLFQHSRIYRRQYTLNMLTKNINNIIPKPTD